MNNIKDYLEQHHEEQMLKKAPRDIKNEERIILENIKAQYRYIGRTRYRELYVSRDRKPIESHYHFCVLPFYTRVFGFIQNGEEYSIEELLNNAK